MKVKKLFAKVLCVTYIASLAVMPMHSVGASGNVIADVDFENYNTTSTKIYTQTVISDVNPALDKGFNYYSDGNFAASDANDMYVIAEDGNKFMRLYSEAADPTDGNTWKDREIRVPVTLDGTNSLEVEYKIRAMDGEYPANKVNFATLSYWNERENHGLGAWGTGLGIVDSDPYVGVSNINSTAWKTIKAVYAPSEGTYKVDFYENGELKGTKLTGQSAINTIRIAKLYNMSGVAAWYDFDDITVKQIAQDTTTIAADTFENYNVSIMENIHPDCATDNLGYIGDVSYAATNPESVFVLKDENSDNKFLRVYNKKTFSSNCYPDGSYDTEVRASVNLDGTNSLAVELKVRSMDGTYANTNMHNFSCWGDGMAHGIFTQGTGLTVVDSDPVMSVATLSSTEWTTLKAIYTPEDGVYRVDYYANGELKGTRTTDKATLNKIRVISVNTSGSAEAWYDIDDVKIDYLENPMVSGSDIVNGVMPISKQTLDIYFNVDMNSNTISDENISVLYDGQSIGAGVIYFPETNHMTLSFEDYLTPDSTYTVVFNNVKSADGVYMNSQFVFKTGSANLTYVSSVISETEGGISIDAIPASGNVYASAKVKNNTGADGSVVIIIASYDASDRLLDMKSESKPVLAGDDETVSTSLSGAGTAAEVRMYLWNGLGTMCPILTTPVTIK